MPRVAIVPCQGQPGAAYSAASRAPLDVRGPVEQTRICAAGGGKCGREWQRHYHAAHLHQRCVLFSHVHVHVHTVPRVRVWTCVCVCVWLCVCAGSTLQGVAVTAGAELDAKASIPHTIAVCAPWP